jgi:hypothetical protein
VRALLDQFRAAGIGLAALPDGGLRATGALDEAARATIRERKAAILAELSAATDASDLAAYYRWRVSGSRCGVYEVCFLPEATSAEVSALYPGAVVEPLAD